MARIERKARVESKDSAWEVVKLEALDCEIVLNLLDYSAEFCPFIESHNVLRFGVMHKRIHRPTSSKADGSKVGLKPGLQRERPGKGDALP